jgi:hypothetical protein
VCDELRLLPFHRRGYGIGNVIGSVPTHRRI